MAPIKAYPVTGCSGWSMSSDQSSVIVRFDQPENHQLALAMSEQTLKDLIVSLMHVTAAFPKGKTQSGERLSIECAWFDVGLDQNTGKVGICFRLPAGGEMTFQFPRSMGEQLITALDETLWPEKPDPEPGKSVH
jgi:hypothetical protein